MSKKIKKPAPEPAVDPDVQSYHNLVARLPEDVRQKIQRFQRAAVEPPAEPEQPHQDPWEPDDARWWLVAIPDGERPVSKGYRKLDDFAKAWAEQEGGDVVVLGFLGQPVTCSLGPDRLLFLPGDKTYSLRLGRLATVEDGYSEELDVQIDGFMGPPDLSVTVPSRPEPVKPVETKKTKPKDDSDGDDQDEEESWSG